jgi:phage portal protein BeeE
MENDMTLTTKILNAFGYEKKSAPDYGRYNQSFSETSWYDRFWTRGSNVNYKHEVGNLDGHSLVMAVVNYTGTRLPEAKPLVQRLDKDEVFQPEGGHDLARLIKRPNKHNIWANYCMGLSASWWIDGNVYLLKVRDAAGRVVELWYLPHFMVVPRWPGDGRSPEVPVDQDTDETLSHYEYRIPNKAPILYPASEIVHIKRGINFANPRLGIGAFDSLVKELYGDDKMALFTATIMRNMGIVVPILSPKDKDVSIDEPQAQAMKETWMSKTTGDRAGEPIINTVAMEVNKFGFSPTELDLSKLRLIPESRVAAVTGIPAATLQFLVGLENGTSYASSEQARQQGYEEVVIPMQQAIAESLNWQLVSDFESNDKIRFVFDTAEVRVLQEDADNLAKRATTLYLGGVVMRGEARHMVGHESTPEDDIFFEPRGSGLVKEGEDPTAANTVPAKFGNYADIDNYLTRLESQMKSFVK